MAPVLARLWVPPWLWFRAHQGCCRLQRAPGCGTPAPVPVRQQPAGVRHRGAGWRCGTPAYARPGLG